MPFNLNFYSVLLLMGFLQGIVYALLLAYRGIQEEKLSDKLLAALLFFICLHIGQYMLGFAGWYDSRDAYSTFMFYFPFHNVLILGPLFYFYFRSLTNDTFKFHKKDWWHFLPSLLLWLIYLVIFVKDIGLDKWLAQEILPHHFGTQGEGSSFRQSTLDQTINHLGTISFIVYLVFTISIYQKYRSYIYNHYSNTEVIQFNWIRNILYIVMAAFIFDFLVDTMGNFMVYEDYTSKWRGYLGYAIAIYAVSILGYNRSSAKQHFLDFEPSKLKQEKTITHKTLELEAYKSKLLALMENEKLYLQSDITLKELATKLKTNSSILSKVINSGFEQNFNDFINSFRVEAVKQRIKKEATKHLTLTAIAYECGINSKATFNRAFKKFTGMSPREFMVD